jgi:uncharacterized delta-60 repeat protein
VQVADHDVGALAREAHGHGAPEAGRSARDDDRLPGEAAHGAIVDAVYARRVSLRAAIAVLLLAVVPASAAADGAPDPAFNQGRAATFAPLRFSAAIASAVDGQGRILIAASLDDGTMLHTRAAVLRLLPSGALDATFGTGGIATIEPPPSYGGTNAEAMALDGAGRIVIAGEVDDDIPAVMRLLPDGTPDPGFGSGGITVARGAYYGAAAWWQAVALDGASIVVAGNAVNTPPYGTGLDRQPVLARFSDSGVPDPAFASGGFLLLERPGITLTVPQSLAIDTSGRIVFGATFATTTAFPRDVTQEVLRLAPSGALDTTFGSGGAVALGVLRGRGFRLSLRASGAILAIGGWGHDPLKAMMAAQLTPDGRLDPAFGMHGQIAAPPGYAGYGIPDCQGDLLISSTAGVQRLGPDGRLDPTFHGGSMVSATVGATVVTAQLGAAATTPGGAIVLAGTLNDGPSQLGGAPGTQIGHYAIAVLRLQATCPPVDTRPPAVSLACSAACRRVTGVALDDPIGRGVRRVLLGVARRTGGMCTAWNGRRFTRVACTKAALRLVAVPAVRGAFRSPPLAPGSSIVRVVAIDRAGNRSPVAVRRVTR